MGTNVGVVLVVAAVGAVGCDSPGTHFNAAVTLALVGQTGPESTEVKLAAEGYVPKFEGSQAHTPASGIAAQFEIDGVLVDLVETTPGHYEAESRRGFPGDIRLIADDESCMLRHGAPFTGFTEFVGGHVRIHIDPAVGEDEVVSATVVFTNPPDVYSQQLFPGATTIDLPPFASAHVVIQRIVATPEDEDGLRLGGSVKVTRDFDL